MTNVTFHYLGNAPAASIGGCCNRSKGKNKERVEVSCFPKDRTYHFRCRTPQRETELEQLDPKGPPPRETRCCCAALPRFVEMTLPMSDGNKKRMEINLRSFARRCTVANERTVSPEVIYDACVEKRLFDLLADIGLPAKWRTLLFPATIDNAAVDSIIPFMLTNYRYWKQECDQKGIPSLYFPAKDGRKCDIEYFKDGAIFVYYVEMAGVEKQKAVAVDLSGKVFNPEWREIANLQQFLVYNACAELFQDTVGILRIYRTSQHPEINRFHVLHERYKFSLEDFLHRKAGSSSSLRLPSALQKLSKAGDPAEKKRKKLSLTTKIKIAQDLLTGLAKLHQAEIAHLSIQPSALFIIPEKYEKPTEAVIGHFEFARVIAPSSVKTQIPTDMKIPFLAPELRLNPLFQNQILVPENPFACDVYSLGEVLRQLFEVDQFPRSSDVLRGALSTEETIAHTIDQMLCEEPALRLTAAQALGFFKGLKNDRPEKSGSMNGHHQEESKVG